RVKIHVASAANSTAAMGALTAWPRSSGAMPSNAREGYQATSPAGTTVSSAPSAQAERSSSGKGESDCSRSQVWELISSAARGAQNAALAHMNSNAITTTVDA